jgi:hypothetical protein
MAGAIADPRAAKKRAVCQSFLAASHSVMDTGTASVESNLGSRFALVMCISPAFVYGKWLGE